MDTLSNSHSYEKTVTKQESQSYSSQECCCLILVIWSIGLFYISTTLYHVDDHRYPVGNKVEIHSKLRHFEHFDIQQVHHLQPETHLPHSSRSRQNQQVGYIPYKQHTLYKQHQPHMQHRNYRKLHYRSPISRHNSRPKHDNTKLSISVSGDISLMIPPTMPAFAILGPAKAGTTSLSLNLNEYVDLVYYGTENHFWRYCGNKALTRDEWEMFINDFINPNKTVKMSDIALKFVHGFGNDNKKRCNPYIFYSNWLTLHAADEASKRYCLHPKEFLGDDPRNVPDVNSINNDVYNKDKPVCWFFEKAPSYVRRAYADSIILANFLPKMKAIMLARNPIKQMISYVSDEYRELGVYNKKSLEAWMYNFIKRHNRNSRFANKNGNRNVTVGFPAILEQCKSFSNKFATKNNNKNQNGDDYKYNDSYLWDEKSILQEYKEFIGGYLYQAKVLNTILGDGQVRKTSFFETTVIFPAVLMFVYNCDETFGFKNWNNFRLIQFEWLYSEFMNDGLSMIKCWLQTGDDMKHSFNFSMNSDYGSRTGDDNAFYQSYYKCPKAFFNDKKYYKDISNVLISKISVKTGSWAIQNDISNEYKQFFIDFFTPCNNALVTLLNQRPEVLLGQWIQWTF